MSHVSARKVEKVKRHNRGTIVAIEVMGVATKGEGIAGGSLASAKPEDKDLKSKIQSIQLCEKNVCSRCHLTIKQHLGIPKGKKTS